MQPRERGEPVASIDTNVLVRLVTGDDPGQLAKAKAFVHLHRPVLVTHLSMLELAWVLQSGYGMGKGKVVQVLGMLLELEELRIEAPAILQAALDAWQHARADFADCFILETVKAAQATPLGTFDAILARQEGCERL